MAKKKEPTIDELYDALDNLGFKYEVSESFEGLEVVNFLVSPAGVSKKSTKKESEVKL